MKITRQHHPGGCVAVGKTVEQDIGAVDLQESSPPAHIFQVLLIHESPPVEGSISGMSLGVPASRRHRAKRERVLSGDRGLRKVAGRRLPSERSLCHPGMIFADKQVPGCVSIAARPPIIEGLTTSLNRRARLRPLDPAQSFPFPLGHFYAYRRRLFPPGHGLL